MMRMEKTFAKLTRAAPYRSAINGPKLSLQPSANAQLSNHRPVTTTTSTASDPLNLRFQLETNYNQPKDKYKSNLLNRVRLENRSKRTLIIKNGKYYQPSNEPDAGRKPVLRRSRTESIKRNNVLFCLSVLSPRKQDINLLNLRQSKYQPKRRNTAGLRRTQSEYVGQRRKLSKQIEPQRRPSIEAELSSLADKSIEESPVIVENGEGRRLGSTNGLLTNPNNNENGKGM